MSGASRVPGGSSAETLLRMTDVSFVRDGRTILESVDWTVHRGERWIVLGPNGAGKSTLLRLASTYALPTRGRVDVLGRRVGGVDLRSLRPRIGYHSPSLARSVAGNATALDAVITATDAALRRWRQSYPPERWRRAEELLATVGCASQRDAAFRILSEGERQRVLLARVLLAEPELLLLDEPAAGLDLVGRELLLEVLGRLSEEGSVPASVLVTHHVEEIPVGATHGLLLRAGRVVAAGPLPEVMTRRALSACFGLPLLVDARDGRYAARALP